VDFYNLPITAIITPAVRLPSSVVEQLTCNEQVIRSIRMGGSSITPSQHEEGVTMSSNSFPHESFDDLLAANAEYQKTFKYSGLTGSAAKGLAIVTCMDSRINPLSVIGMRSGDAKILRNAGARVTEDVLRTLVLATYLLNVNRILVMPHTDCRMAQGEESAIHKLIDEQYGVNTSSLEFRTTTDQRGALASDINRVRSYPLLRDGVVVAGAIYDVKTGTIEPFEG
jgi:carbonic anhydrase